jgi:Zn-dependent protease with chaperone function
LKLYIKNSDEINAYAVGSMGRKNIVLTVGLVHHYLKYIPDNEKFLIAIRSILGHEMSHLINKDFLPGLLIIINQKVTNLLSEILLIFFTIYLRLATKLRLQSNWISLAMYKIYHISSWVLSLFSRIVIDNLYEFLKRFFSREIEFRSDRQSAKAFGGINMAFSLSLLGNSGYFTLFSTHPSTKKRMRKVEVVEEKNAIIRSSALSDLSNFVSIMILPMICLYAAHLSKIDLLIQYYVFHYHYDFYSDVVMFFNRAEFFIKSFIKKRW